MLPKAVVCDDEYKNEEYGTGNVKNKYIFPFKNPSVLKSRITGFRTDLPSGLLL